MQDMSGRAHGGRAFILSVQVQWQYQVCTPTLPSRVAFALAEEALRVMQDTVPLYKAL